VADKKERLDVPRSEDAPYQVGYRKPPAGSRFEPGRSGNPKGRPKGARSRRRGPDEERLKVLVLKEADRVIHVNEGERRVTMPMIAAIIRSLAVNAARGRLRSQQTFLKLVSETERANKAHYERYLSAVIGYKLSWEEELDRRARDGGSGPEPITHPDDIEVDLHNNRVIIKGPRTKEEKAAWDALHERLRNLDGGIPYVVDKLKRCKSEARRKILEELLGTLKRDRQEIVDHVGEPKERDRESSC
jgi:Family of unknown function (DUF5681)